MAGSENVLQFNNLLVQDNMCQQYARITSINKSTNFGRLIFHCMFPSSLALLVSYGELQKLDIFLSR